MRDELILVNREDRQIGTEEKIKAHKEGRLHRAFSIFVFNSSGALMLQRRAAIKYHCPGLWTNTCCSHPRPGETVLEAAHRRLKEEMGFDCELKAAGHFIYRTKFDNGLSEHEYLHLLVGRWDGQPVLNPDEADDWSLTGPSDLTKDMKSFPEKYTYWFKKALPRVLNALSK